MKVLVSACMLGLNTRYDGENTKSKGVLEYLKKKDVQFFPLCAEQLGGLCTPREPSEIEKGFTAKDVIEGKAKVLTQSGKDVTSNFINGAKLVLKFCKEFDITHAILQDRSPSCGYSKIYDGTFSGEKINGRGVLAQMLKDNGIKILDI